MEQRVVAGIGSFEPFPATLSAVVMNPSVPEYCSSLQGLLYGCNLLGRGIGVNRLKRGGSLFEGIAQREREEYIIRTRGARSEFPSSGRNITFQRHGNGPRLARRPYQKKRTLAVSQPISEFITIYLLLFRGERIVAART
jgi:hypothetical protein